MDSSPKNWHHPILHHPILDTIASDRIECYKSRLGLIIDPTQERTSMVFFSSSILTRGIVLLETYVFFSWYTHREVKMPLEPTFSFLDDYDNLPCRPTTVGDIIFVSTIKGTTA